MSSSSSKASALKLLGMLVMMSCLAGCSQTLTTPTAAIEADKAVAAGVCSVWVPVTYVSTDDAQTQLEARANNAARDAYCD